MKNKIGKGLSKILPILILLVMGAFALISVFVYNLVNNKIRDSACIEVMEKVQIVDSNMYTCFHTPSEYRVRVSFGDEIEKIAGFKIKFSGPSSKTFEIKEGSTNADVKMFGVGALFGSALSLPSATGEETYVFKSGAVGSGPIEYVVNHPIMTGGKVCGESDRTGRIDSCF